MVICSAIPTENTTPFSHNDKIGAPLLLTRPSPIHPDIPSDPKPKERIIPIPEQHEINKHKRESDQKNHVTAVKNPESTQQKPTVLPLGPLNLHHNGKNPSIPASHSQHKRDSQDKFNPHPTVNFHNPSLTTSGDIKEHPHNQEHENSHEYNHQKRDDKKQTPLKKDSSSSEENHEINRKPYTPPSQLTKEQNKRDIPVPLVDNDKDKSSTPITIAKTNEQSTQHPAVLNKPIPVAELLKNRAE